MLTRKTERFREIESEKSSPQGGWPCTRTRREFKPPGPVLELQPTTWESSDIAITLTAGPFIQVLNALLQKNVAHDSNIRVTC